ncbi:hypothetical protein BBD39_06050 [Arsenophonus endosymbiont of Bemisia tabaci Asia II 3]|nr:hypothetical protein BBD39_06050 [Arsenophonus endosymbiont of Bemisia tabaci Asia II 3]
MRRNRISTEELLHSFGALSDKLDRDRTERLAEYEKLIPHIDKTFASNGLGCSKNDDFDVLQHLRCLASQAQSITQCQALLRSLQFDELSSRRRGISEAHKRSFSWILDAKASDFPSWLSCKDGGHLYGPPTRSVLTKCTDKSQAYTGSPANPGAGNQRS